MKKLIKTIECADCKLFGIMNHQRYFIGAAEASIEIYQLATEVSILGRAAKGYKKYEFSVILCSNPELDRKITPEYMDGLRQFEIRMLLKRKDEVYIPFEFLQITDFDIEAYDEWVFDLNDYELTQRLMMF